jgi:hypothetical protein
MKIGAMINPHCCVCWFTHELWCLIGIGPTTSTAYHPHTDGQTGHVNQEPKQFIHIFTSYKQDNWDKLLPAAQFAYNNDVHSSTQQVPFMTDTGRLPQKSDLHTYPPKPTFVYSLFNMNPCFCAQCRMANRE